eukprot:gene10252-11954_t
MPYVNPTGGKGKWEMKITKSKQYEHGAIDRIEFGAHMPDKMLVSFNKRVTVIDESARAELALSSDTDRNIADYKDSAAYSATFRADGRLVVVGGDEPTVRVYNAETRNCLRKLRGHTGPVHVVRFVGKSRVISASNDRSVRLWDIDTGEQTAIVGYHSDQIRALAGHPTNENMWLSGAYDHKIKVWDISTNKCVHTFDHGAPVEDIIVLQSGAMAVSCGGTYFKIWDLLSGAMVFQSTNHVKTITSLYLNSKGTKFLTGSLDHMVKVFSTTSYAMISSVKFSEPVLCVTMNRKNVYVGTTNGSVQVASKKGSDHELKKKAKNVVSKKNKVRNDAIYTDATERLYRSNAVDKMLRRFEHRAAFDTVLLVNKNVDTFFKVVCELQRREALLLVLEGRDAAGVTELLNMIHKMVMSTKYIRIGTMLMDKLIDVYQTQILENAETNKIYAKIKLAVKKEMAKYSDLLKVAGALDLIYTNQVQTSKRKIDQSDDQLDISKESEEEEEEEAVEEVTKKVTKKVKTSSAAPETKNKVAKK